MKRILTLLLISLFAFNFNYAQEDEVLTNKNGAAILPASGDWGLGFNGSPVFNYVGNLLGSSGMNSFHSDWDVNQVITGRYFKDANTAYRGGLRIGFSSDQGQILDGNGDVGMDSTISSNTIVLSAGLEKRRGYGRLVGYYGGDVMVGLTGGKNSYEYTDKMPWNGSRMIESKQSSGLHLGLNGVVGVEYFILPKISLGMEYNWASDTFIEAA
jgi:hypothetical protein